MILVIIDEIQRVPELFPVLRALVDRPGSPARFLILGSASRDLTGNRRKRWPAGLAISS